MYSYPFSDLRDKRDKLKKKRTTHRQLTEFLATSFRPKLPIEPSAGKCAPTGTSVDSAKTNRKKGKFDSFKDDVMTITTDNLLLQTTSMERELKLKDEEIATMKKKLKSQEVKITQLIDRNSTLIEKMRKKNVSRLTLKVQRKTKSADLWREKYFDLQKDRRRSNQQTCIQDKLQTARKSIRRLQRASAARNRSSSSCSTTKKLKASHSLVQQLKSEIQHLENELLTVLDEAQTDTIETKPGRSYTPAVRQASYFLQTKGVAQANVSETLSVITEVMTGKKLPGLPSQSTQNKFVREMKSLSRQHVKEHLDSAVNTTLKYDGTTKKHGHLVEVEVATPEQTFLLGLRSQAGGTADAYSKTILNVISTVENTPMPSTTDSYLPVAGDPNAGNMPESDVSEIDGVVPEITVP